LPHEKKKLLEDAFVKVMRPLVRLMLAHGVTYRDFCEIGKTVFFEAGKDIVAKDNTKATASRLSILTGLHRKDVTAFIQQKELVERLSPKKLLPVGAAIVAKWTSHHHYLEEDGRPKALPYSTDHPDAITFTGLVESISKDIRPRTYVDELKRLGLVSEDEKGHVYLQADAFIPASDFAEKLQMLVRNVGDHMTAATTNMEKTPAPFFERSAFHGRLSEADAQILREMLNAEGMAFLRAVYKRADALSQEGIPEADDKNRRVTIGLYMYDEEKKDA
jgi:Family of unknown function (DUF6502)